MAGGIGGDFYLMRDCPDAQDEIKDLLRPTLILIADLVSVSIPLRRIVTGSLQAASLPAM